MKLIDILARKLTAWPEHCPACITQDKDGMLNFYVKGNIPQKAGNRGRVWQGGAVYLEGFSDGDDDVRLPVAEDQDHAVVTHAQWLAAVMDLEVEKVKFNDPMKMNGPVAAEWNGEGLPPVGAVCEARAKQSDSWRPYEVIASTVDYLIVEAEEEGETPIRHAFWEFRRFRSAEQIAAEERKVAIWKMACDCGYGHNEDHGYEVSPIFAAAYDKGYRKQVAK